MFLQMINVLFRQWLFQLWMFKISKINQLSYIVIQMLVSLNIQCIKMNGLTIMLSQESMWYFGIIEATERVLGKLVRVTSDEMEFKFATFTKLNIYWRENLVFMEKVWEDPSLLILLRVSKQIFYLQTEHLEASKIWVEECLGKLDIWV